MKFATNSATSVSIANLFIKLHSSYRNFAQQLQNGCSCNSLAQVATYTLGAWTYLYERQTSVQSISSPSSENPPLTLDDILLEYLPPTHPHLPLLLGYTISLFNDYADAIGPLLPSLILLTRPVSRRATIELTHTLFEIVQYCWEDFILCMTISRLIGREDEYLSWLSQNMNQQFVDEGGLGHLLRVKRNYPSFTAAVYRALSLALPSNRKSVNEDIKGVISDLVQLVCSYCMSAKQLSQLALLLRTPLPSLALFLHLTLKSLDPNYPDTFLLPLLKRNLDFRLVRERIPIALLKTHITCFLSQKQLSHLAISIARDWKDHINYDDEDDEYALESTQEFLERIEREYLTETEGVKWRYEDVLAEWIGEWPDGRELESTRIAKVTRLIPDESSDFEALLEDDAEEEDEEFGGSMVKRRVPRSGLLEMLDTPLPPKRDYPDVLGSERKAVKDRLFKLAGIGQTPRIPRVRDVDVRKSDESTFFEMIGLGNLSLSEEKERDEDTDDDSSVVISPKSRRKRTVLSDDEHEIYHESDEEFQSSPPKTKGRKRRRFGEEDDDSHISDYHDSDIENRYTNDFDMNLSDEDELSFSSTTSRPVLRGIPMNRQLTRSHRQRQRSITVVGKMLVRESSPVLQGEGSDDELAM